MKKLLALVLCALLFVSMVPMTALAAADLSDAYAAIEQLDNAYARFGAVTVIKNAHDGYAGLAAQLKPGSNASDTAKLVSDNGFGFAMADIINFYLGQTGSGISYEGLFDFDALGLGSLGTHLFGCYNLVVEAGASDVAGTIGGSIDNLDASVAAIVSGMG